MEKEELKVREMKRIDFDMMEQGGIYALILSGTEQEVRFWDFKIFKISIKFSNI